jgi:hypothetical protein
MSRNLVVCLDGTRNEPETGPINVTRLYDLPSVGQRVAATRAGPRPYAPAIPEAAPMAPEGAAP